jgi:tetratricopeptide (TPR) repeat protein
VLEVVVAEVHVSSEITEYLGEGLAKVLCTTPELHSSRCWVCLAPTTAVGEPLSALVLTGVDLLHSSFICFTHARCARSEVRYLRLADIRAKVPNLPDTANSPLNLRRKLLWYDDETGRYQQKSDFDPPDDVAASPLWLGNWLRDKGDAPGARAAYQAEIDSGDWRSAAFARLRLGDLFREQGQLDAARAAFQAVINTPHSGETRDATLMLGSVLQDQGDLDAARAVYQSVIDARCYGPELEARIMLGRLLRTQGDLDAAREVFESAINNSYPWETMEAIDALISLEG